VPELQDFGVVGGGLGAVVAGRYPQGEVDLPEDLPPRRARNHARKITVCRDWFSWSAVIENHGQSAMIENHGQSAMIENHGQSWSAMIERLWFSIMVAPRPRPWSWSADLPPRSARYSGKAEPGHPKHNRMPLQRLGVKPAFLRP
jgi:hypothetical protein